MFEGLCLRRQEDAKAGQWITVQRRKQRAHDGAWDEIQAPHVGRSVSWSVGWSVGWSVNSSASSGSSSSSSSSSSISSSSSHAEVSLVKIERA